MNTTRVEVTGEDVERWQLLLRGAQQEKETT
jgi:hypothetical protein